jgi:hypothetical protein
MTREEIADANGDVLLLDPQYDRAIIGIAENYSDSVVAYSTEKVLEILIENGIEDVNGAKEFFEYNILGTYKEGRMPIFVSVEI